VSGSFSNLVTPWMTVPRSKGNARWQSPMLEWGAAADFPESTFRIDGSLQADSREVQFQTQGGVSPAQLAPLVGAQWRPWLDVCNFASPPSLSVTGRLTLPPLTNRSPEWATVWPTLEAAGQLEATQGRYRGVRFSGARVPFAVTNEVWRIPELTLARPEGSLRVGGFANLRSREFRADVRSGFDPLALRPAFPDPEAQHVFDFFAFQQPPRIEGTLSGRWGNGSELKAQGTVWVTNATFRGQEVRSSTARVVYADQFLSILNPVVLRDSEEGRADGIGIDLKLLRLHLTNAVGRMMPQTITRTIGQRADRLLEPYVFDRAPSARAEGTVPLRMEDNGENMRFEIVEGGPFHWQRFRLEQVKAIVWWRGDTLEVTNVVGRWHGAEVDGWAHFEFPPADKNWFEFFLRADRVDLRKALKDLQSGRPSKVEGSLSGELRITRADPDNLRSWQGYGQIQLTNGLLWDIPVFGAFSPILNTFIPGLGNSRARHASATFHITNSVIHSQDLVIAGSALRMNYRGRVDFEQRVNGRMEAELFREVPALGLIVSKLFWPVTKLFEYEVTGTLHDVKTEEHYTISKILLMPLRPFRTLKDLINLDQPLDPK
jgi:hypothetical protein